MAEGLLRHRLDALEVDIDVASAGFTLEDRPADRKAVKAAERLGASLSGHRSRIVTPAMIDESMIIVGMVRKHVREVLDLCPDAKERSFTLKELVTRGRDVGPMQDHESAPDWIGRASADRDKLVHIGAGADTDIDDPIGRSSRFFQSTAHEIDGLISELITFWWPELAEEHELFSTK